MESTGVFEGTHYELIEGELIDKMGKKHPHVFGTFAVARALRAIFGEDFVLTEAPIAASDEDNPRGRTLQSCAGRFASSRDRPTRLTS